MNGGYCQTPITMLEVLSGVAMPTLGRVTFLDEQERLRLAVRHADRVGACARRGAADASWGAERCARGSREHKNMGPSMSNERIGSTWKKWDLHVHTPASIVNNYPGQLEEAWEAFFSDLEALPPDFKVIGVAQRRRA